MNTPVLSRLWREAALSLLLLTAFGFAPSNAQALGLPIDNLTMWSDTDGGNNHYYGYVTVASLQLAGITWAQASALAAADTHGTESGHLATIESAAENAFITNHVLPAANPGSPDEHLFVGASQAPGEIIAANSWAWETGETWAYTNWSVAARQPDGWLSSGDRFLGIMINNFRGEWFDVTENAPVSGFVIEFDTDAEVVQLPEPDIALLLAGALAGLALVGRARP